jgi:hypothetical protein
MLRFSFHMILHLFVVIMFTVLIFLMEVHGLRANDIA